MINLVIADDELIIRQGLKSISWEDYSFNVVGVAKNALEVLELFESNTVDVLLTDIRMPGLSGLELSEQVLKRNPKVKIIFLTGYSEFDYAKQAIKMGAFDYLLKPIGTDELLDCMKRVQERVLKEREEDAQTQLRERQFNNYRILTQSSELVKGKASQEDAVDMITLILQYIAEHYAEKISLVTLSKHLHFSTVYISRLIKKKTGFTFLEILTNIRMYFAAELLRTTDLKGYEICDRIGLTDEHYFTQVFKKVYGVTPNEYKRGEKSFEKNPLAQYLDK